MANASLLSKLACTIAVALTCKVAQSLVEHAATAACMVAQVVVLAAPGVQVAR